MDRTLTQKEKEVLQLEHEKESRTKKLFKQLKKDFSILLLQKVKELHSTIKQNHKDIDEEVFEKILLQDNEKVVDEIVSQLREEYYNDDRYYCNNELFYKLKLYYLLKYKNTLKNVLSAIL